MMWQRYEKIRKTPPQTLKKNHILHILKQKLHILKLGHTVPGTL
jgi:hypothetical protein